MGIFDFIKNQFVRLSNGRTTLLAMVYRFPLWEGDKNGCAATVRESQAAIFVNEDRSRMFQPGRYTLTTQNMPVLTKLKSGNTGLILLLRPRCTVTPGSLPTRNGGRGGTMRRRVRMLRLRAFEYTHSGNDSVVFL